MLVHESGQLPSAGGYSFPAPEHIGSLLLPFIFQYLCADSQLHTSYLNTQHWRCSFVEIQMYPPVSQADFVGVQDGLVDIKLHSGDQLKKRSPTPLPSFFSYTQPVAVLRHWWGNTKYWSGWLSPGGVLLRSLMVREGGRPMMPEASHMGSHNLCLYPQSGNGVSTTIKR